jgi:hypothetical protein
MYTLYLARVINSVSGEVAQEYDTLEDCVNTLYDQFWLDARVVDDEGYRYTLVETPDVDDPDYVTFSFGVESALLF